MEPTATMSASPAFRAEPESAEVRTRQLAAARRRATALLGAVTVLFVAVTAAGVHGTLLGYVTAPEPGTPPSWYATGDYEIEIAGERVPADASLRPLYDPRSERSRG